MHSASTLIYGNYYILYRINVKVNVSFQFVCVFALQKVGCDNKLGSSMKRDRCGVCGGDNFTCRTVTGSYNNARYGK